MKVNNVATIKYKIGRGRREGGGRCNHVKVILKNFF